MRVLTLVLPLLSPLSSSDDPWVVYDGGTGPGAGKHVVLVAGDEEYRSEEALPLLGQILARHHGFRCTVLFASDPETGAIDPERSDHIPGLEALETADLLVLFTRFRRLPDEDMARLRDYVESGRPVFGIRTATHAFAYEQGSTSPFARWSWNDDGGFGRLVLGETWVAHHGAHGKESTRGVVPVHARTHPVLRGVEGVWGPTDVYAIRDLPLDATVLLEGTVLDGMTPAARPVTDGRNEPRMPLVWTRERLLPGAPDRPPQRIVCSTIGASVDLANEGLRRLFLNACYWAVGLEDAIPERSTVDFVRPYEPTMFGFGSYVRGVFPADHALSQSSSGASETR